MREGGGPLIRFRILGAVELHDPSGAELRSILTQPKRLALLAYLARSASGRFHSRETLLGLLWPELNEARGRAALSQALYYLRQALGAGVVIGRGGEEIGVDPDRIWCDAAEFDRALERGDAEKALEMYRGDLLAGHFLADAVEWERWVDTERAILRSRAAAAAWSLAEATEAEGRAAEAARRGRQALALAGDDETHLRRLIELLDRAGDRVGAIRAYEEFASRLRRDYDLEPSPETRELAARLRSAGSAGGAPAAPNGPSPSPIAAVERPPRATSPRPAGGARDRAAQRRRSRLFSGGLAAALAVLAVGLSFLWSREQTSTGTAPLATVEASAGRRIAVLPFDNFSPDPDDAYIADGMTEELISRLSRLSGLRVIARTSVMLYREAGKSVAEVGRELGVGYVLEGSVRRSGHRLRVSVQLIDAKTQHHVWAEEYDAELPDVLDVQREIAERVAGALPIRPGAEERGRLAKSGTADPEAHLLVLRGRYLLARDDSASFGRARTYFEASLERDPTYAQAWSGLSAVFDRLAWARALPPAEAYPRARAAAERALELDADLAEAHASLARVLTAYYWDSEAAETHFRRALELDPSDARTHQSYAAHLMQHGRLEEGRVEAERALELDPLSFLSHFEPIILAFFERRYDDAVERAERLAGIGPGLPMVHLILAKVRLHQKEYAAALEDLDRTDPGRVFPPALATRGFIYGATGREEEAREMLAALEDRSGGKPVAYDRAVVHLGLGETDRALERLEEAIEERDWRVRLLKAEPMFDPLRSEPRFQALLKRAGF